jgi:segregation and condensation protein B
MQNRELKAAIEAVLAIARFRPIKVTALARALGMNEQVIEEALQELAANLMVPGRGVQLRRCGQTVQLEVKPQYAELVRDAGFGYDGRGMAVGAPKSMSEAALETLIVIAWKQPVTTADINASRGVESLGMLLTLQKRKLITGVIGPGPRRMKYWITTQLFLEVFNLTSLDDLYRNGRLKQVFRSGYYARPDGGVRNSA